MSTQNWRPQISAEDYFGHKQKQLDVADRRPVIRKPADLAGMGPGINAVCTPITDFNDLIAAYNGYYSAELALNGPFPNPGDGRDSGKYVGMVVTDSEIGGYQQFTRVPNMYLNDYGNVYRREFSRADSDPDYIDWGPWYVEGSQNEPIGTVKMFYGPNPNGWLPMTGFTFDAGQYPELAAILYGNVTPDLSNRFPMGSPDSASGDLGGSAYLAPHSHDFAHVHESGYHEHSISPAGTSSTTFREATAATSAGNVTIDYAASGHAHGASTGGENPVGSQPAPDAETADSLEDIYEQLPPYMKIKFYIKATHLY